MATLNDSVTFFMPSADVSLGMEKFLFATGGRFVREVPLYRTISLTFFIESRVHHVQSRALSWQRGILHLLGVKTTEATQNVNKTDMSHMRRKNGTITTYICSNGSMYMHPLPQDQHQHKSERDAATTCNYTHHHH